MAFCQTSDGRIAGHGPDGIGIDDRDKSATTHSGSSEGGLAAGMSGADHGNIIFIH